MTILGAATRKALVTPAASRAAVRSQARIGARRRMGGDGGDHDHVSAAC